MHIIYEYNVISYYVLITYYNILYNTIGCFLELFAVFARVRVTIFWDFFFNHFYSRWLML